MVQAVRIFGGALGVAKGYIDADVQGITFEGSVILKDKDSTQEWSIEVERLQELARDDNVYDLADVDTAAEDWAAIDDLEEHYTLSTAEDKTHFVEAARVMFRGAEP